MNRLGLTDEQVGLISLAYVENNVSSDNILIYQHHAEKWTKIISDILGPIPIDNARKLVSEMKRDWLLPKLDSQQEVLF